MFKLKLRQLDQTISRAKKAAWIGLLGLGLQGQVFAQAVEQPPITQQMVPLVENPSDVVPSGVAPSGVAPSGVAPSGVAPSGVAPSGVAHSGVAPSGVNPAGFVSADTAPAGLTLDQAEQEGVKKSPVYRQSQDEEHQASWDQVEKFSDGFLPHLSVNGQHYFDVQYSYTNIQLGAPPAAPFLNVVPNTVLNLDASFDLFDGFANVHQLDSANNDHHAAQFLSDWSLFELQQKIRLQFYQAIAAQKLADMADQNVRTLQEHLRIVGALLQYGHATKYDILRVQVQLDEALSDQNSARDKVVLARENLTQLMGLKQDDRPLNGELPVLDADSILQKSAGADIFQQQDLQAKEFQARAAEDQSAATRASLWFPKITLIGEYQWYNTPDEIGSSVSNNDDYRTDYYVGASASWDLFDGLSGVAKANEDDEKAKSLRDQFEAAQTEAPYDFDLWKRRLTTSVLDYKAKLTDVEEAKESARLATVGYEAGTLTTTDVLDAELEEYRAAESLVQSQMDALEGLVNLELSLGKRL